MPLNVTTIDTTSSCRALQPSGWTAPAVGTDLVIGNSIGAGGFGEVFELQSIGTRSAGGLVIKRHDAAGGITPDMTADVLRCLHRAIDGLDPSRHVDVAALLRGTPFWIGTVRWKGADTVVSVAVNLFHVGYVPLNDVLGDVRRLRAWLAQGFDVRLALAEHAASVYELLEEIEYLHADLNPENTFASSTDRRVAFIDFDSGWIPGVNALRPLTWGKPDDFLAPEVKLGGKVDPDRYDRNAERWSLAYLLHYLLFGVGPLFFLEELSVPAIDEYQRRYCWPDIDTTSPMFNKPNRAFYSSYLLELADLPPAAIDLFREFVSKGALDPGARPSGGSWRQALASLRQPPVFDLITVSTPVIIRGGAVDVRWYAPGAAGVEVEGVGAFMGDTGVATVCPDTSGPIRLLAHNPFGTAVGETAGIAVLDVPQMRAFPLPRPNIQGPEIALNLSKLDLSFEIPVRPRSGSTTGIATPRRADLTAKSMVPVLPHARVGHRPTPRPPRSPAPIWGRIRRLVSNGD